MKVRQILTRKGTDGVRTVQPGATIGDVAKQLSEARIGCLVVSNSGGDVAGIVSERDIVRALGRDGPSCLQDEVGSIMTVKVVTCGPDDHEASILGTMTRGRFRHIPVIEDDALIGLVSIGDVVKARIDTLESENEQLEGMIRSATA